MKFSEKWSKFSCNFNETIECVYDLCFNGDGSEIWVTCGKMIGIYTSSDGTFVQYLSGHTDFVKYLSGSNETGCRIASAGDDKFVLIWSGDDRTDRAIVAKYQHKNVISCMAFNPCALQLITCSAFEFIFWTPEQKSIQKFKVKNKILTSTWSCDGQFFALGHANGIVSVRYKNGEEYRSIEHPDGRAYPIRKVLWNPNENNLTVIDSGSNSLMYSTQGQLMDKETISDYEITCIDYYKQGEYILLCATNKQCILFTKTGLKLGPVTRPQSSTILTCRSHPKLNTFVIGCQNGQLVYSQIAFNTIHGLYLERYACRDSMTNVLVRNLSTGSQLEIQCRAFIKKLAINESLLAVQLNDHLVFYENTTTMTSSAADPLNYKLKQKIAWNEDCNLLLVLANKNFIACKESVLQMYTFDGQFVHEWDLNEFIRYAKIIDNCLLFAGLKNGQVFRINFESQQVSFLTAVTSAVKCLDLNVERTKIAIVEEDRNLLKIFDLKNDDCELIYEEPNVDCVSWNLKLNHCLCYSTNNHLVVNWNNIVIHQDTAIGFVVNFIGTKAYCLSNGKLYDIVVPVESLIENLVRQKCVDEAADLLAMAAVPGFGAVVTNAVKLKVAFAALTQLKFAIAVELFDAIGESKHVEFVCGIRDRELNARSDKLLMKGDICAYLGEVKESGEFYRQAIVEIERVEQPLGTTKINELETRAQWALTNFSYRLAIDFYNLIENYAKSIELMKQYKLKGCLKDLADKLMKHGRDKCLTEIADCLAELKDWRNASEIYERLDNREALFRMLLRLGEFPRAWTLVEKCKEGELASRYFLEHAVFSVNENRFAEAQHDFWQMDQFDVALPLLQQLAENALEEQRFGHGSFFFWFQSQIYLKLATKCVDNEVEMVEKFYERTHLADIYYTYDVINEYLECTFTTYLPESIFNIGRYLLNEIRTNKGHYDGVCLFKIYLTVCKQARRLKAFRFERELLTELGRLRVPDQFRKEFELSVLRSNALELPERDPEELLPLCYRCSNYNAFLQTQQNNCSSCGHTFVYSFYSFEQLPVIEFHLDETVSDREAVEIIESNVSTADDHKFVTDFLLKKSETSVSLTNATIKVERSILEKMDSTMTLICKWPRPLNHQYYWNLIPNMEIVVCPVCLKLILAEDYERSIICTGTCSYCKNPPPPSPSPPSTAI